MRHLLSVLFGASFTIATAWALGRLLFAKLHIALPKAEAHLLPTFVGAALLSATVFLLCAIGLARTEVFLPLGMLAIALAYRTDLPTLVTPITAIPKLLKTLFWTIFVFYAAIYLSNSLAPEISPDGVAYHLGLVARYFRQHGFQKLTTNMYGNLSQGTEMLFLYAFSLGRHAAAATVHCSFLLAAPLLFRAYGQRIGRPIAGLLAGMLVYLSPLAGIDAISAYNDVALAITAFALFYLLEVWRERESPNMLLPIGLLAGFCFAIKYTGFVAFLYAATVVLSKRRIKPLLPISAAAAVLALPWLIKNWIYVGNPFSPFLNRYFPNPYIHLSFEQNYTAYFRTYDLHSFLPIPWTVTVGGELGGQLGPLFLLTPLILLQLRGRPGRHAALALIFFLLPYPNNIGARFLLPAIPFAALGIALAVEPVALPVLAIASILAWPRIIDAYRTPAGGWQIHSVPWREALHLRDSDKFLFDRIPHILIAREIDEKVPANSRVWSTSEIAAAYCKRDVLVNYESAEGELVEDILTVATHADLQPTWNLRMTFPSRPVRHLRIEQTALSPSDTWSIGELRFWNNDREIEPARAWRVTANPNPWDAPLAIDRNPATRWRSWESIHPGMTFDIEFNIPIDLDRVEAHSAHDQWKVELKIPAIPEARIEKWNDADLSDQRHNALQALLARNIGYLLIEYNHPLAKDIYPDPGRWGLKLLADRNRTRLYQITPYEISK